MSDYNEESIDYNIDKILESDKEIQSSFSSLRNEKSSDDFFKVSSCSLRINKFEETNSLEDISKNDEGNSILL